MMKALARFLLSFELLVSHPGEWWQERNWLFKFIFVVSSIFAINGGTLFLYQKWSTQPNGQELQLSGQDRQEITALKQQIAELKAKQEAFLSKLGGKSELATAVADEIDARNPQGVGLGGGVIDESEDEENDEAATTSARIVFLPPDKGETTPLYKQPNAKSAVVTSIATDTWYLIVNRETGWYQVEVDEDGRIGWIPASVAQEQGLE